jgi:hypothetical protein
MGNIQVVARGREWVVIQRGNLDDISTHMSLDEAIDAARAVAQEKGAKLVVPSVQAQ